MKEIRAKDLRNLSNEDIIKKLKELSSELLNERGLSSMGGAPHNPGKVKSLRRQIARIKTVLREKGVRV
ncbi:MAG: 50S ribosomal protein L29 [Thermoplasmata archaeon]|jgi:large subunit ribosomal protein L29|nr:50S ribosomal protein L29 [Thermoplasmata archaeon]MVT15202.1 50S ribosomal protein L29 [Euryarchaeota archaeon]MVT35690.1 50S ribosomal protein L29 [Euryarchaeota archaeon]